MTFEKQDLKEFELPFNSFIGGWFIDETVCDKIIDYFNQNSHLHQQGKTFKEADAILNTETKESTDLVINSNWPIYPTNLYQDELQKCLINYLIRYDEANNVSAFGTTNYNIQYYKPTQGFKKWHCERCAVADSRRHLVFMTFLNDVPDGGTEFKYQNLTVPAKKGLTVIWPTDWTHTHKGQITNKHEKYIATGWYYFSE
jgi:prolyl 4-hydroxylase